jgi:hypothetical protein
MREALLSNSLPLNELNLIMEVSNGIGMKVLKSRQSVGFVFQRKSP